MKILHVVETARGGCGSYLNEILPQQQALLGPAQLRCLAPRQHLDQLDRLPPELLRDFDRPSRARGLPQLARALRRTVRDWQPDLIHAHSTFAGAITRTLSLLQPLPPIVYCPHGWVFDVPLPAPLGQFARLTERWLAGRSARIVAISQAERQLALQAGIPDERLTVVRNGVARDVDAAAADWPDTRLRLLFVGRLDRQKGADTLLEAVAPLQRSVCLRIVGERVHAGGRPLPTLPHVSYTGWLTQAQVAAQIAACDAVVMPSRWEGFGLVAVEAMRAAKPVLASAVGGLQEIVLDRQTGQLFPPDQPLTLRRLLAGLDREQLRQQGLAGRERFLQHYTSQRTHEELMRLYAEVLGRPLARMTADALPGAPEGRA